MCFSRHAAQQRKREKRCVHRVWIVAGGEHLTRLRLHGDDGQWSQSRLRGRREEDALKEVVQTVRWVLVLVDDSRDAILAKGIRRLRARAWRRRSLADSERTTMHVPLTVVESLASAEIMYRLSKKERENMKRENHAVDERNTGARGLHSKQRRTA